MKRLISIITSILLILSLYSCKAAKVKETESTTVTETAPSLSVTEITSPYPSITGHAVWDMKLWDGFLYIGAGDYDRNDTVDVGYRYDLEKEEWDKCGIIRDEQISRFLEIRGTLVTPGIDPTGTWDLGHYFALEDGRFESKSVIPGGIHNFDIVEYDGCLFFGAGVLAGSYPVLRSDENGENLEDVVFLDSDGEKVSTLGFTQVRCYDLMVLRGELYAVLTLDKNKNVYKYNGSEFVFYSPFANKMVNGRYAYVPILEKKVLDDTLYLTSGRLYATEDMDNIRDITPEGIDYIADILTYDGQLYALANRLKDDGEYDITVLKMSSEEEFAEVFTTTHELASMSFEYDGIDFYIGVGKKAEAHKIKENILKVTLP